MLELQPRTEPDQIGKYIIKRRIGRGSMGVVYEGYDPFVQRPVAIKVASPEASDPATKRRFQRSFFIEAHAAGNLQHPNIVSVFDAGIDGMQNYIVMELVQGKTLQPFTRGDEALDVDKAVDVIFKCCKALDYAHRQGVVHRDIKPSNIMLTDDGTVKIMDFGIAQLEQLDETQPVGLIGSPNYMSPEQVKDEPVGPQSDIYSLGVVMFSLLTKRLPFEAETYHSLVYQIVHHPAPSILDYRPDLPDSLAAVVARALSKDPKERYENGLEFAAALSRLFDQLRLAGRQIENIERRDMLAQLDFFRDFTIDEIQEVMYAATWVQFEKGDTIINEGDIDDTFYIIVNGSAVVEKGGRPIGWLNAGDCFGEIGFITHQRRTATIIAETPVTLMKINATLIGQASEHCQLRYYKSFTETLIKRLSETNKLLAKENGLS
jgi:serine/threonine protein kinase